MTGLLVVGVDGCRAGWVLAAVSSQPSSAPVEILVLPTFVEVRQWCDARGAPAVGVDMPIGLPVDGSRESDRLARQLLGPRRSSFFPTPAHAVLATTSWDEALALSREASGKGISKQAFNLLPKVRQVRAAIEAEDQPRFSEVHPETSFAVMAQLAAVGPLDSKRTAVGVQQRRRLITEFLGAADVGEVLAELPSGGVAADDVLDALAAAWTAGRMAEGSAVVLGDGHDPDGFALTVTA